MFTIFEKILLGHLVGDYLFQPKKMAIGKLSKGLPGLVWCLFHCLLYTTIICLFASTTDPIKILLIFMSHFPIDRWSLASKWLKMIKGRDFIVAYKSKAEFYEIDLSFSTIVYVIVDNTMHILLMAAIFNYL
jgi:hypothetical protein